MPTDPETPGTEPNLELPSFGFGRRKKRGKRPSDDTAETAAPAPSAPGPEGSVDEEPPAAEATIPLPTTPRAPAAPPAPVRAAEAASTSTPGPTPARPPARPAARPPSRPTAAAAPAPAPARPAPARPAPSPAPAEPADTAPAGPVEDTRPAASAPPAPPVVPPAAPLPPATDGGATDSAEPFIETPVVDPLDAAAAALDAPRRARPRRQETRAQRRAEKREAKRARKDAQQATREEALAEPVLAEPAQDEATDAEPTMPAEALVARLPAINPALAAIITGVLSGLTTVLLAFGAARGCDAVRGTESCGGGLGLLALVAILALEVLIGASLLKAWQISDPVSTSFLGVGIVATIAMLAFLDSIDSPAMLVVIPLMTGASFALSWWVTVKFVDEHPMTSEADAEHGEPPFRRTAADQDEDTNA